MGATGGALRAGLGRCRHSGLGQQSAGLGDSRLALLVAQETEVANFDEAFRQQMQTEPAHKLLILERHGFVLGTIGIILPGKGDRLLLLIQAQESARADGHPMSVARQISQNLVGPGKGPLGIDVPLLARGRVQKFGEGLGLGQRGELAVELKLLLGLKLLQTGAELAAEDRGERADGEEVLAPGADPARAVAGETAAGDDAVQMVMADQGLAPGVQDGRDAQLHAETVLAELEQGLTRGGKQERIKRALVLLDERVEHVGQGENQMEVRHWQKRALLLFEPAVSRLALAERAMAVAAGVRHKMALAALLAAVAMAAQGERTAGQERTQDLPMMRGQLERGRLQAEAQDLGQLEPRRWTGRAAAGHTNGGDLDLGARLGSVQVQ